MAMISCPKTFVEETVVDLPSQHLVVAILEVTVQRLADRIHELVLVEVDDFTQSTQIRTQRSQLSQVQHRTAEEQPR